ncbi:F-actin-capping protein subunit alpha [Physocladia obscura]|uniref:F-actin-capping protein subunit alpha n=1 Tax=Physocladia obscura TaxID=109957 RepID=A0AAD5T1W7_9FUNG|nr:F-actin-capping protein subunit alpha [Physocladia obscura]
MNSSFSYNPENVFSPIAHILPREKSFIYAVTNIDYPVILPADDSNKNDFDYKNSSSSSRKQRVKYASPKDLPKYSKCIAKTFPSEIRETHAFFSQHPWRFVVQSINAPVFSRAKIACFADILIPAEYHAAEARRMQEFVDVVEWKDKLNVLFWRGSTTGGVYDYGTGWRRFHRTRLIDWERKFRARFPWMVFDAGKTQDSALWALKNSSLCLPLSNQNRNDCLLGTVAVDVGFNVVMNAMSLSFIESFIKEYPYKSYVQHKTATRFKYLLVVDGNTWPGRMQWYLSTKSVVLYAGVFHDFFMSQLVPWVHYVPVRLDFSDLDEKLVWLVLHDDSARKISENARKLVSGVNSLEAMQCYTGLAFLEYSWLYNDES